MSSATTPDRGAEILGRIIQPKQRANDCRGGSFESLRADYDEKGEAVLVGVRPGGKQTVGVEGLSEGTGSQLYLALRLAIWETDLTGRESITFNSLGAIQQKSYRPQK